MIKLHLKIFHSVILAFGLLGFFSCENESDFSEDLKDDSSARYTFYSDNPEAGSNFFSVSRSYKIGENLTSSDFPSNSSSDFKDKIPGYKMSGWVYYKNPRNGSTEIPDFIKLKDDNTVDSLVVTSMPASFYVNEWNPISYSVTFYGNGGLDSSGNSQQSQENFVYDEERVLNANPFTREKYVFNGWGMSASQDSRLPTYGDSALVSNLTINDGEVVKLFAMWIRDKITIAFSQGEGSGSMESVKVSVGDFLPSYEDCVAAFTAPEGKNFGGFTLEEKDGYGNSKVIWYEPGHLFSTEDYPNDDVTLTASYWWKKYTVNLYDNFISGDETCFSQMFDWGMSQPLMENPYYHFGYDFLGWNTAANGSGTTYEDGHVFAEKQETSINLYAQWKLQTLKVTFNANSSEAIGTMASQDFAGNALPANLSVNAFTRDGYVFTGWNTAADGSGTYYYDGQEINEGNWFSGDLTLYAQWSVLTYSVDFDFNNGYLEIQYVEHDKTAVEPSEPSRTGYAFDGWYKEPEFTNRFNFSTPITENIILYAKWNVESRTIYFDLAGGKVGSSSTVPSVTITYEALPYTPPYTPVKEDYLFGGWSPSLVSDSNWATSDLTMTALWEMRGAVEGNLPSNVMVEYTPTGMTFTVVGDGDYSSFMWLVDGSTKQNSSDSTFTVNYDDYTGSHTVAVIGFPADDVTDVYTAGFKFRVR